MAKAPEGDEAGLSARPSTRRVVRTFDDHHSKEGRAAAPIEAAPPPVVIVEPPKPPTEPTPQLEAPPVPLEVVAQPEQPSEPAPPTVRRPVPAVQDDPDTLAKELALVDRARSQRTSAPAEALQTLAEYDAQFPKGALTQEASLVRIEALLSLGRRAEAEAFARTLIAKDRGGLLKKRVEALLAR